MRSEGKLIEIACTGNCGRSPVGELITRNHLESVGASEEYDSISSGTMVASIKGGNFPIKAMLPIVSVAKERGNIYNTNDLEKLNYALQHDDIPTVKKYFGIAANLFVEEEEASRKIILKELGIVGKVKTTPDQTIVRPNSIAVLAMDQGNLKRVNGIYQESTCSPTIESLDIENAFGLGEKVYRNRIEQLLDKIPRTVNRIVGA